MSGMRDEVKKAMWGNQAPWGDRPGDSGFSPSEEAQAREIITDIEQVMMMHQQILMKVTSLREKLAAFNPANDEARSAVARVQKMLDDQLGGFGP